MDLSFYGNRNSTKGWVPSFLLKYPFSNLNKMDPIALSQLATGLSVLAGAVVVKSVIEQKLPTAGTMPRCSTCNGSGRVTCLCARWSDGDVGCRSCSGSGRMSCRSCGGGGRGRPITLQLSTNQLNR
ncbi:unnamed protein product [Citrullus colocynthis]|uniref:Uncharacterized protein n=1 Tax=Citrullus colocynthis TaxID=252529 RepID=A0ABP0Y0G3_9ROSI